MTCFAYIFKARLLARFAIIFLGVLSGCGGGGSGSAEQRFSAQPRISLADFDNSQASSSPLIVAGFVMATDTYQARRLTGRDALESYINKLPSQEHLKKISANTQWVSTAWIPGRNVGAGVTETVFEHLSLNGKFFVWGQQRPLFPLFWRKF